MVWPTDSLTKTNFDAGTDSPADARAELEALYDHVKLISAEVTDGETVWHSGNDGANSGLHADLLDGQHGSYYTTATNITSGVLPLAQIPTNLTGKNADQLDGQEGSYYLALGNHTGTVSQSQVGSSAVGTSQLKTTNQEISTTLSIGSDITLYSALTSTSYNFFPSLKVDNASQITLVHCFSGFNGASASTSYVGYAALRIAAGTIPRTAYADFRYIQSSPPYIVNGVDYDDFIFLAVDDSGQVIHTYIAKDPPWAYNGPTKTTPDYYKNGKAYKKELIIPDEINSLKETSPRDYFIELSKLDAAEFEITQEIKNKDIDLIPHPFLNIGSLNPVILSPDDGPYSQLCDIRSKGVNISEIIRKYCVVDSLDIPTSGKPPGVAMHRIKWKNTR